MDIKEKRAALYDAVRAILKKKKINVYHVYSDKRKDHQRVKFQVGKVGSRQRTTVVKAIEDLKKKHSILNEVEFRKDFKPHQYQSWGHCGPDIVLRVKR